MLVEDRIRHEARPLIERALPNADIGHWATRWPKTIALVRAHVRVDVAPDDAVDSQ